MKAKIIILMASIALMSITAIAQAKAITQAELWKASYDANKISEKIFPRRMIAERKNFEKGKLKSSSVITTEYDTDGNERVVNVYKSVDKVEKREIIRIGSTYYCQDDKTVWKKSSQFCGEMGLSAPPNVETSKISSEVLQVKGKNILHFSSYVTHRGWLGQPNEPRPLRFINDELWVNENGSTMKSEGTVGFVEPNMITETHFTTTYHYQVKVSKILAPIK